MADIVASYLWMCGIRPGALVLLPGIGGGGTRGDIPVIEGTRLMGAVLMTADPGNAAEVYHLIRTVEPSALLLTQRLLDGLRVRCLEEGGDLRELFTPVSSVLYAAKPLSHSARSRLDEELGAETFDMGGIGDLALWGSECSCHDGLHLRDDLFEIECLDLETGEPVAEGEQGRLVYTSLWDEGMNWIRWDSEDVGWVKASVCQCGRTTPRVAMLGRISEAFRLGDRWLYPPSVEAELSDILGTTDVFFQVDRERQSGQLLRVRVALPDGSDEASVGDRLSALLGESLEVDAATQAEILEGSPWYKYRQVRDV